MSPTARVWLGRRPENLSCAALLLAIGLGLSEVDAQRVPTGFVERGVEIDLINQPYAIQGATARALLDQMRILGPGGGWVSFPYRYEWNYQTPVLLTAGGLPSMKCRIDEFQMRFMVQAIYPRWNRPDAAPDKLIAAWESFEELFLDQWVERRRYMIDLSREIGRQVRRLEESCMHLRVLTNDLVRDLSRQASEARREAIAEGPRVQLRWPPEGYDDLLAEPASLASLESNPLESNPLENARAPEPAVGAFTGAAASDLRPTGMTGVVAGLKKAGEVEYLEAVGFADLEEREPLTTDAIFRFPAFTEVVVSTLAASLAGEGLVDLHAPLSSYLPNLGDRLGAISLHHLLSHRSGLDDASPGDSVWSEILDDLDDRAVFTHPDAVFSFSRYDYPLAVRALGRSMEEDVIAEASRRVLDPLGMENTSLGNAEEGLPVLLTTAPDLLRFGSAWVDGEVGGAPSPSTDSGSAAELEAGDRVFAGGVWKDLVGGQPRVSVMCAAGSAGDAAGVQIFPESGVVFVLWSRARGSEKVWPDGAARFLLEGLGAELDVGSDIFGPRRVRGDAQLGTGPRPCEEPSWNDVWVSDPGSPAPAGDWAGRYVNGDRVVELQEREGVLWLMGGMEFEVMHFEDDTYFATLGGQPLYPFRLVRDNGGRRYAVLGDRAHIHHDDRSGN